MEYEKVMQALEVMGKGMFSIFVVIGILTLIVVLLGKVTNLPMFKHDENTED